MAADGIKVVLSVDTRPFDSELRDFGDRLNAHVATTMRERAAALERMHRRHLAGAADVFEALAGRRRRFDPRRLVDRRHARACRRLVAWSEAAAAESGTKDRP